MKIFLIFLKFLRFFSFALGGRKILIRRLASIALVLLGVHAAAHTIDAMLFSLVDHLDLLVDQAAWFFFEWISQVGGMTSKEAVDVAEKCSTFIDLEQKEFLAHALSLMMELFIDVLLLDLVWGTREKRFEEESSLSFFEELKRSAQNLKEALWPLDLERFFAPLVLLFFTLAGALSTGIAVESAVHNLISNLAPLWGGAINVSAAAGLLFVALLILRFLPDLIYGGVLRASERSVDAAKKIQKRSQNKKVNIQRQDSKLLNFRISLSFYLRGWSVAVILFPLSLVGLLTQDAFLDLIQRTGAH